MPRPGTTHVLAGDVADSQVQLYTATEQTLVLEPSCTALMLSARGTAPAVVSVTFDNTAASATNGIAIPVGSAPTYVPVGYHAHGAHTLRALGPASSFLDVVQMS
jgi:hypothetical protein